jgi:anti-sigma regulatory factor (Ser/Thr protein kinase)
VAELRFTFDSPNQEKEPFFVQLRRFAAERRWPPGIANEIELIFEEWLTNVQQYGLAGNQNPEIRVVIQEEKDLGHLEVTDNGVAFDPTRQKDPDLRVPVEERTIGGLGIFMIKRLSRSMLYERRDEWNRLVILKDLKTPVLTPKT